MFYLKHFFQVLKNNRLNGLFFVMLTLLMTTSLHNKKTLKQIFSMANKAITRPYFNALISDQINLNSIARKMKNLPGVEKVTIKRTLDVGKEIGFLSGELKTDFVKGLADLNYASITIEIGNGLQARSQSLIKEYLTRLVGKHSVAISNIKKPKKLSISKNDPYLMINNWGDFYIIGIISVFWLVSCMLLLKSLNSYAYLIEKFQRKSKVGLKIYATGLAGIVSVSLLLNIYFKPTGAIAPWIFAFSLFALSMLFFYKKSTFKKFF